MSDKISVVDIARLCHDVNRAYQQALEDENASPPWDEAPDWQQRSTLRGVAEYLANPATPEEMHKRWSEQKRAEGWKYGKVKDSDKRTHPCLVSYEKLPREERVKDNLFIGVIESLIGRFSVE